MSISQSARMTASLDERAAVMCTLPPNIALRTLSPDARTRLTRSSRSPGRATLLVEGELGTRVGITSRCGSATVDLYTDECWP